MSTFSSISYKALVDAFGQHDVPFDEYPFSGGAVRSRVGGPRFPYRGERSGIYDTSTDSQTYYDGNGDVLPEFRN